MSELVVPVVLGQRSKCMSELVVSRFLSEISELTSVKKEDVISTLQYLNLINYYKVRGHRSTPTRSTYTRLLGTTVGFPPGPTALASC